MVPETIAIGGDIVAPAALKVQPSPKKKEKKEKKEKIKKMGGEVVSTEKGEPPAKRIQLEAHQDLNFKHSER